MSKKDKTSHGEYIEINYEEIHAIPTIPPLNTENIQGYKYVFLSDKEEFLRAVKEVQILEPRVLEAVHKKSGNKRKLYFGVTNDYLDAAVAIGDFCWWYDIEPVYLNGHKVLTGEDYLEANGIM